MPKETMIGSLLVSVSMVLRLVSGGHDFQNSPFSAVWANPTEVCVKKGYDVAPLLKKYRIVRNSNGRFKGDAVNVLYKLGLYPRIAPDGTIVNGGIPKVENVQKNLYFTKKQLYGIIAEDFNGLATIDWEDWRPIWDRNWGRKSEYPDLEEYLVAKDNPTWNNKKVTEYSKISFENAARKFMFSTLNLARKMYPSSFWGYYLFPTCYSNGSNRTFEGFHCSRKTSEQNDRLKWMWQESNMLNPSIYVYSSPTPLSHIMLSNGRIRETLRIVKKFRVGKGSKTLIFPYVNIYQRGYFNQTMLSTMIGVAVNYGLPGVLIWGSSLHLRPKSGCKDLYHSINEHLGPYVERVTVAANKCSQKMCDGRGRCADTRMLQETVASMAEDEVIEMMLNPFQESKYVECLKY